VIYLSNDSRAAEAANQRSARSAGATRYLTHSSRRTDTRLSRSSGCVWNTCSACATRSSGSKQKLRETGAQMRVLQSKRSRRQCAHQLKNVSVAADRQTLQLLALEAAQVSEKLHHRLGDQTGQRMRRRSGDSSNSGGDCSGNRSRGISHRCNIAAAAAPAACACCCFSSNSFIWWLPIHNAVQS